MPVAQRVHLGRAAGLAAGFHDIGHLVVNLQERQWTARAATAAEFFLAGANRGQVSAGAGAVFEEHRLAVGQPHDVFHVVLDRLDEAGAALRILVLRRSAFSLARLAVVIPVPFGGVFADSILMVEADVEPDRRVERSILIDAQPGQLVAKNVAIRLAEVSIFGTPVGYGPADAVNELLHRCFALRGVLLTIIIF